MMSTRELEKQAEDRRRIAKTIEWPLRPILPMVNRNAETGAPERLGVLLEGTVPRIYRVPWWDALNRGLDGVPVEEFRSVQQMQAHGWEVD